MSLNAAIEKFDDSSLLELILDMASEWVYSQDAFPTQKEKAALLAKLKDLEKKGDEKLVEKYLGLVANIFSDTSFLRTEFSIKLEGSFLIGTRYKNPVLRRRFTTILKNSVGTSLNSRLNYVFGIQNWEPLAEEFWLCQALELLLGCISGDAVVALGAPSYRLESISSLYSGLEDGGATDGESRLSELTKSHEVSLFLILWKPIRIF